MDEVMLKSFRRVAKSATFAVSERGQDFEPVPLILRYADSDAGLEIRVFVSPGSQRRCLPSRRLRPLIDVALKMLFQKPNQGKTRD